MASYQKILLVGNLGSDPELRFTGDGSPVASFSMAVNRKWDGGEETAWFRISAWGNQAEPVAQYLSSGSQVMVEGRMNIDRETGGPRVWEGNDGQARASFEVNAQRVIFLQGESDDVPSGPSNNVVEEDGDILF